MNKTQRGILIMSLLCLIGTLAAQSNDINPFYNDSLDPEGDLQPNPDPQPGLRIEKVVMISWDATYVTLEQAPNANGPWTTFDGPITRTATGYEVIDRSGGNKFFRLQETEIQP